MTNMPDYNVAINVETQYVPDQSYPEHNRYVFAYTITITNTGTTAAQLLKRHWIITDANNKIQEVRGDGVVGEQPHLKPGKSFSYTSAAVLETPLGCMQGKYEMLSDDGTVFDVPIDVFRLSTQVTLH